MIDVISYIVVVIYSITITVITNQSSESIKPKTLYESRVLGDGPVIVEQAFRSCHLSSIIDHKFSFALLPSTIKLVVFTSLNDDEEKTYDSTYYTCKYISYLITKLDSNYNQ
jgi:hypothetical protein